MLSTEKNFLSAFWVAWAPLSYCLMLLAGACSDSSPGGTNLNADLFTTGPDLGCTTASPAAIDCTSGSAACPLWSVTGDAPATTPSFTGYTDPSVRKDPSSSRLWIGYTYPAVRPLPDPMGGTGTIGVNTASIHLAHSDDGGQTVTADTVLWPAVRETDPSCSSVSAGRIGFCSSETVSLIPNQGASGTTWYGVRLAYFLQQKAGYNPDAATFSFRVVQGSSPAALATSAEQVLGTSQLNALSPTLSTCAFWNDPAVFFDQGTLYLAAECLVYTAGKPDDANEKVIMFSAVPSGPIQSWTWRYVGVLADHQAAVELGEQELMQVDLVRGMDGKLLTMLTPSHSTDTGSQVHQGCRVLEMDSLNPPLLSRSCGNLVVRASITGSDEPQGTGACGYDPSSLTGVLSAHRPYVANPGTFTIVSSKLRP